MPDVQWMPPRQVLIVDDHELVRLGLSALLDSPRGDAGPPLALLHAASLREGLQQYEQHQQHIAVVLLDLHLPDAHGLSALHAFLRQFPHAPIVALSGDTEPTLARDAVAAGALAFLSKSGQLGQVSDYINALLHAGSATAPGLLQPAAALEVGRLVQTRDGERLRLTPRQGDLLDHVLAGLSNREIADQLDLSEGTVKNHVSTLLLIFGVRSRSQLISRLR